MLLIAHISEVVNEMVMTYSQEVTWSSSGSGCPAAKWRWIVCTLRK